MYPLIVCFNCGRSLGDIYDAFRYLRAQRNREAYGNSDIHPVLISITENNTAGLEDIFNQLGLRLICCRTNIATQITIDDVY
jgi:DNA-directed RNA polymerase, subunit N (RpoN/RPB10)